MAGERHGHGMLCVYRPLAERHGRGTAWARQAICESAFSGMARQGNRMDAALARHAICESVFGGTAWQGNGLGAAWARHSMCESALRREVELKKLIFSF